MYVCVVRLFLRVVLQKKQNTTEILNNHASRCNEVKNVLFWLHFFNEM